MDAKATGAATCTCEGVTALCDACTKRRYEAGQFWLCGLPAGDPGAVPE